MSNTKQPTHVKIKKCSDDSYWYKNEIGKTFKITYMVGGMYRVWKTNSQSFCVKMDDIELIYEATSEKQLSAELVEKMLEAWHKPDSLQQCAQIAVQHTEEENRELREALKESTKAIEWYMDSCTPKNEDYTTFFNLGMNQRVENEQLLNKNEDD